METIEEILKRIESKLDILIKQEKSGQPSEPATERQINFMNYLGLKFKPDISKSEASKLIDSAVRKGDHLGNETT
jgi:hypothetical protein